MFLLFITAILIGVYSDNCGNNNEFIRSFQFEYPRDWQDRFLVVSSRGKLLEFDIPGGECSVVYCNTLCAEQEWCSLVNMVPGQGNCTCRLTENYRISEEREHQGAVALEVPCRLVG